MTIIDGKAVSANLREKIKAEAALLPEKPGLAVILVGDDPASQTYVKNKKLACEQCGFYSEEYRLPASTTQEELLLLIEKLNCDDKINGILVQLPVPEHIDDVAVIQAISPEKDVDAFGYENVGKIMIGNFHYVPCTPAGVMQLLKAYNIEIGGKNAVVVGRSNIVGKPQAMLLLHANATVTIAHSKTANLADVTKNADILVSAVGIPKFIKKDMVKDGAVVIDVGMNRDENGKLCGDVDFEAVKDKTSYITPVPGGVGPMTITMLMQNTLESKKQQIQKNK
ncbi:MAG: bifunctional methylenetetrahydrofolate dehydrogenase/methenyltetrahydrofolate cyclohydrolase FolD [Clostridia bacterium]|nr:bifunctional methylenetetrahydrofolate dehydrogenase/methenyltetrahydrofolate cyclohydrolase FolD [Clostridia bacterium]